MSDTQHESAKLVASAPADSDVMIPVPAGTLTEILGLLMRLLPNEDAAQMMIVLQELLKLP
jgi:hypothetical protein